MTNRRLFNVVATIVFLLFFVVFILLYVFLVFIPYGYSNLTVAIFCVFSDLLFIFFVIEFVFAVKSFTEYKRFLDNNEHVFGERIRFYNYDAFTKKVNKLMIYRGDQYIITFSPIKISVNDEIYQSEEIKKLNKEIALYFLGKFHDKKVRKLRTQYCYDNKCFLIYYRGNKNDVISLINDIEDNTYRLAKEKDLRIFVQTSFGIAKILENKQFFAYEYIDRSNIARRQAEANRDKFYEYQDGDIRGKLDDNTANKILEGLKNQEFVVFYQPKFNLKSKQFIGSEALTRWNTKDHGLLSPTKFIQFSENKGLIHEIDIYVLRRVCKDLNDNKKRGRRVLPVSVNFSIYEFYCPTFLQDIKSTVEEFKVDPSMIEIEVTEDVSFKSSFLIVSILKKLKEYGFKIVLDDFGSGMSNISSIQILPVDVIKLDKKLIDEIEYDFKSRQIVDTLIKLCKTMSCNVVAEGVENEKQVEILRKFNCDSVQGYYYAKPMSLKDFERFLVNNPFEKKPKESK